ncbi:MAG: hypothetical protein PHD81_03645 [Candidatus Nanoarchaeia archaeon]|nr:hypothetical protein [Candidatus Nanoarchaeia archaeon]MDD5588177.1 hypothetical protein [Candidatus Nanoarchaeia archaeon]
MSKNQVTRILRSYFPVPCRDSIKLLEQNILSNEIAAQEIGIQKRKYRFEGPDEGILNYEVKIHLANGKTIVVTEQTWQPETEMFWPASNIVDRFCAKPYRSFIDIEEGDKWMGLTYSDSHAVDISSFHAQAFGKLEAQLKGKSPSDILNHMLVYALEN